MQIKDYSERIDPHKESSGIVAIHLKRYVFASDYCKGKKVLDAACGFGYGSFYLAREALSVVGVDISQKVIDHAKNEYQHKHLNFLQADVSHIEFLPESFDVICSFETIEHLQDVPSYLKEMTRVLKSDGVYIVSTPQVKKTNLGPNNPHHTIEFCKKDFITLLSKYFKTIELYGQRRKQSELHYWITAILSWTKLRGRLSRLNIIRNPMNAVLKTTPFHEMTLKDILITKDHLNRATELIAVCREPLKKL